MNELICIVCPRGCHLKVYPEDNFRVTGNECARGKKYAREEIESPTRTITSTVRIEDAMHQRCPVKTSSPIPKQLIFDTMKMLDDVLLHSPVAAGETVIENVCGTGVNLITTRAM